MMLSLESSLATVFKIYGTFWALALVVLFFGVGMLSKRR
jgi:UPF0716 family protein affecting phage T7 exclusion